MDKKFQIIVTTRSIDFMDSLPIEFRCLLEFSGSNHQVYDSPSRGRIVAALSAVIEPDIIVFCEDDVAETIIRLSVKGDVRRRLKIVRGGTKSKLALLAEAHLISGWKQKVVVVWDGDVETDEIKKWLDKLDMKDEEKNANINRIKLPGTIPPEEWIVEQLNNEEGLEILADELNEEKAYAELLLKTLKSLFKHHDVFRELAQQTQLDEKTTADALIRAIKKLPSKPLEGLKNQFQRIAENEQVIELE